MGRVSLAPILEGSREMIAQSRYFLASLAALLAVATARSQETGPPIPQNEVPQVVGEPVAPVLFGPSVWFEADWLWALREGTSNGSGRIIRGPDATNFNDLPGATSDHGYRLRGGIRLGEWIFEGVYLDSGRWKSELARSIDGVAFNDGINGEWLGRNYIDGSSLFAPVFRAASLLAPVPTADDESGLGPSTTFTADAQPVLTVVRHSSFRMVEANVKGAGYFLPTFNRGLRLGAGYVHAKLNEDLQASLSGTFRAVSTVGLPTVGLPSEALTDPAGGNLLLISGGGTGFSDGTDGSGIPSRLVFMHQATTRNQFNGAQVVLDGTLFEFQRMDFCVSFKAGMFDNFASGTIVQLYGETNRDQSVYGRALESSRHRLAFMGGIGLNVGYYVTDEIRIRCGYDVLFLSNLALADQQLEGFSNGLYQVQTNGSAVIHGANLGLEFAF
jgi:hypothetical protein